MNTHRSTHLSRSLLPSLSTPFFSLILLRFAAAPVQRLLGWVTLESALFMAVICETSLPFPSLASADSRAGKIPCSAPER